MLSSVLSDVLIAAVGVAISPLPIVAVILMLLSARAGTVAPAFAIGWLAGIVVAAGLIMVLVPESTAGDNGEPSTTSGVIKLLLGIAVLALAARSWRGRPQPGSPSPMPKWMAGIDSMKPVTAIGLGALLSAVNPKNLALLIAGGISLAQVTGVGGQIVGLVLLTLVAGCTVAAPVIGFMVARDRAAPKLDEIKAWLIEHNAAVMTVVLLVLGVALIGKGAGILIK